MTGERVITGPGRGRSEIDRELIIGRESADITIDDPEVSRRHAAVRPVAAGVELEDLGSQNGTFVDGRRITGPTTLTHGAGVQVGSAGLRIEIALSQPTRLRPVAPAAPDETVLRPTAAPDPQAPEPPSRRPPMVALIGGGAAALVAVAAAAALLLSGGGSAGTGGPNPHCAKRFPKLIRDGFPQPRLVFSHDGVLHENLTATTHTIQVAGHTYEGMWYDGQTPGPALVICPGDRLTVNLTNKLPVPTNLHVHGLHVTPTGSGDNVFAALGPLQSHHYRYQIPLNQPAGSFWYHPHYHPLVDAETTAGLLGAIIVEGGLDRVMPEVPQRLMIIHGGKPVPVDGKPLPIPGAKPGQVKPPPSPGPAELLVNGVYQPSLHIRPGEQQRWRIFNASGEHYVKLALPGLRFDLLAVDGHTLRFKRPQKRLLLGPGERAEVLVRGGPPGHYALNSLPFQPCFKGCFDPFGGVPPNGRDFGFQRLVNIVDDGKPAHEKPHTGPLARPVDLRRRHVDVHRVLNMTRHPGTTKLPTFPLNGKLFKADRVDITMKLDSIEEWTIKSPRTKLALEAHNFHIHTNDFQVVAVNGKPLNYVLWQDTVNISPGGSVTILIHPIDFVGRSVFHCHVDFHEDNGMMGVFQIERNPSPARVNAHKVIYLTPHRMPHDVWARAAVATQALLCHRPRGRNV